MEQLKVSNVARSKSGFIQQYRKGLTEEWKTKRINFIKRHLAKMKKDNEPRFITYKGKKIPSRRHLALIAWAYSPIPSKI